MVCIFFEKGELKYKGETVQGSNVVDLVNDVLSKNKYFNPQGWEPFGEALRVFQFPFLVPANVGTALHFFQQELYLGLHCFWYAFQNFVVDQV
jgi:hypothetical protein